MATRKTGLGRGLDALLGPVNTPVTDEPLPGSQPVADSLPAATVNVTRTGEGLRALSLDLLQPGEYQPRRDMHKETLEELADSIRNQGVLSPISVRPLPGTTPARYEIIAGERRWRASQLAGVDTIPAIVRDVDDEQAAAIALIENLQREDLNPLEEAKGLLRLIDEFDLTHQEAGQAVGKSRAAVSNLIRLLDLATEVQQLLATGSIDMGHARALLPLTSGLKQSEAAKTVVNKGLSVRQTEALVKKLLAGNTGGGSGGSKDRDILRLEKEVGEKLGTQVAIQHTAKGKGKLVIAYNSTDELEGILRHIK